MKNVGTIEERLNIKNTIWQNHCTSKCNETIVSFSIYSKKLSVSIAIDLQLFLKITLYDLFMLLYSITITDGR